MSGTYQRNKIGGLECVYRVVLVFGIQHTVPVLYDLILEA